MVRIDTIWIDLAAVDPERCSSMEQVFTKMLEVAAIAHDSVARGAGGLREGVSKGLNFADHLTFSPNFFAELARCAVFFIRHVVPGELYVAAPFRIRPRGRGAHCLIVWPALMQPNPLTFMLF